MLNTCQFGCCASVTQNLRLTDHGNENNDDGDDDDDTMTSIITTQYFIIKSLMRWQNSHKASYGDRTENIKIHPKTNYEQKDIQKLKSNTFLGPMQIYIWGSHLRVILDRQCR